MQKNKMIMLAILLFPFAVQAQLGGLLSKAKNKTAQRMDNRTDKAMDDALDKLEGKSTPKQASKTDNSASSPVPDETPSIKSYSKFDFIPGEEILYYENFETEAIGELPTGWNTDGAGEVVTLNQLPGKWLKLHQKNLYLASNSKPFGENYTVEFDVLMQLKSDGHFYPYFSFGFFATNKETNTNEFLQNFNKNASVDAIIYPAESGKTSIQLKSFDNGRPYYKGDSKPFEALEKWYGQPVHVAIQVQKERLRIWLNEEKAYDLPKAIPLTQVMDQLQFMVHVSNYKEDQYGMYIGNLKVATGKPDTRHKLIEEGKFSTTGILFDVQSAVIRSESYGVVKEIAVVLKEHDDIKIKVIGHTSSDGDDKKNMELSAERAAAVKDMLISEFGIDAARIETLGKGETEPVADNKTKEGKALNRRVEFIKL
jgi:outer membrane protein OmpA-like peptidoglycan-associated protein